MPLFVSIGFDVYMNSNAIQRKSNIFEPTFIEIASCVLSNTHTKIPQTTIYKLQNVTVKQILLRRY